MKVLIAHNFYRSTAPSGEDNVVMAESELLSQSRRFSVERWFLHNDDLLSGSFIGDLKIGINSIWSRRTYSRVRKVVQRVQPDVVHVHNIFPQISPSIFDACYSLDVPVVMTVHNFRFVCASAMLLRNGEVCERCIGGNILPALYFGCYRDSRLATVPLAVGSAVHRARKWYLPKVNKYIALTNFAKKKLVNSGFPNDDIVVKPNFVSDIGVGTNREEFVVYVGRLSKEKGVFVALEAIRLLGRYRLLIVGDGPDRVEAENYVRRWSLPVDFLGFRSREEVSALVRAAACQLVPSLCYEGFPLVVAEALAAGTPIIASDIGGLGEIIQHGENGLLVVPGCADALARTLDSLMKDSRQRQELGAGARQAYEKNYSPSATLLALEEIYRQATS